MFRRATAAAACARERGRAVRGCRRGFIWGFVALVVCGVGGEARAESAVPDPTKWNDAGALRVFEPNGSRLLSGVYRRAGSDNGASVFEARNDMRIVNANSVSRIDATVTLLDAQGSGGTGSPTYPRAEIGGFFYWDGTGTGTSSDDTGHVFAATSLALNLDTGALEARRAVSRCTNADCSTFVILSSESLGPIRMFEPHLLRIEYDGTRFTFQLDANPAQTLTPSDTTRSTPTVPLKTARTRFQMPASSTATASVLAVFDNVSVNGALYETFDDRTIPRVSIMPGSGTFSSRQVGDVDIVIETGGLAVVSTRVTFDGVDVSSLAGALPTGTLTGGGIVRRLRAFPVGTLPPGPHVLGVEVTLTGSRVVRGFALWNILTATEP
jgi:hypothetical protein